MAVVLLYWIYLFISAVSVGIACVSVCKIKEYNPFILPFIGGFGIAIIAGVWSIWGGLGSAFEMSLASSSLISIGIYRKNVLTYLFSLKAKITALPLFSKLLLGTLFVFALAQSAGYANPNVVLKNNVDWQAQEQNHRCLTILWFVCNMIHYQ